MERERPGAAGAPTHDEVIERLGGREKMLQIRAEKTALDRYPAAMERLGRILDALHRHHARGAAAWNCSSAWRCHSSDGVEDRS